MPFYAMVCKLNKWAEIYRCLYEMPNISIFIRKKMQNIPLQIRNVINIFLFNRKSASASTDNSYFLYELCRKDKKTESTILLPAGDIFFVLWHNFSVSKSLHSFEHHEICEYVQCSLLQPYILDRIQRCRTNFLAWISAEY